MGRSMQQLDEQKELLEAVVEAIPESSVFIAERGKLPEQELDHLAEYDRAMMPGMTDLGHVVALSGHHLRSRGGQREAWNLIEKATLLLVLIEPPEDIYNQKLKGNIGKEMMAFMSDVPMKQATSCWYFYGEQDEISREWKDPLIRKLERIAEIRLGKANARGRS